MTAYQQTTLFADRPSARLRLRELPEHETPRGRIRDVGSAALSDAELLALLLCHGSGALQAIDLAQRLLLDHGGWAGLLRTDVHTLCQQHGIGAARAAAIKAALEIARRVLLADHAPRLQVKSPTDIAKLLMLEMSHLDQEHLRTVLLDTKNYVQEISTIYIGSLNTSLVRVGEVFRQALKRNSAALIVVHNHPSGDPTPSPVIWRMRNVKPAVGALFFRERKLPPHPRKRKPGCGGRMPEPPPSPAPPSSSSPLLSATAKSMRGPTLSFSVAPGVSPLLPHPATAVSGPRPPRP